MVADLALPGDAEVGERPLAVGVQTQPSDLVVADVHDVRNPWS